MTVCSVWRCFLIAINNFLEKRLDFIISFSLLIDKISLQNENLHLSFVDFFLTALGGELVVFTERQKCGQFFVRIFL